MAVEAYTLEQAEEDIAQLRGDSSVKEEFQEVTTLVVDGQITATGGTAAAPSLISTDTWHDSGSMTNSWSKAGGYFKYKLLPDGMVIVAAKDISCSGATVADGTTILSAGNGLPAGYAPTTNKIIPAYSDVLKVNGGAYEAAAFKFVNDGSVQCLGFSTAASAADCYAIFPVDI